jgi:hypothetical protein
MRAEDVEKRLSEVTDGLVRQMDLTRSIARIAERSIDLIGGLTDGLNALRIEVACLRAEVQALRGVRQ